MEEKTTKIPNAGKVFISQEESGIKLYPHQIDAVAKMTETIARSGKYPYKGILVLPTGGGKTLTAARWISENILDKGIKVLWLAHRHELLEQAKRTFTNILAYKDVFKHKKEIHWRVISGIHDKAVNIKPDDEIIFASKDSLRSERSFQYLKTKWLKDNEEIFIVIDEAHHAPAKTYRKLITNIEENVPKFRMLGLTATPFRTMSQELGYLHKIFPDDMVYKIDLKSLITLGILSEPKFEEIETGIDLEKDLNEEEIQKISEGFDLDSIGSAVAKKIADNNERNNLIVNRYIDNKDKYGKTIVFAVNKENVIALNKLFNEKGIRSDYVMSDVRDASGRNNISSKDTPIKIQRFRNNELDVLINVNILTEGTDIPQVQTVFLTRPTHSKILMTQMIGRALRGVNAGGTPDANIVTFIDEWSENIAWVNPEKLYIDENTDFNDLDSETRKRITRLIAIAKIEEFAILSDKIIDPDAKALIESVDFIDRIPKGVYKFSFPDKDVEGNPIDKSCEILVYDNLEKAYRNLIADIPLKYSKTKEDVSKEEIHRLSDTCESEYFHNVERYPAYRIQDIDDLLRYYFETGETPKYYEFTEREKYDVRKIAKNIIDKRMDTISEDEYISGLWAEEKGGWQTFFDYAVKNFRDEISLAKRRIMHPEDYIVKREKPQIEFENRRYVDLSMEQLRYADHDYEKWLRNKVFEKYQDKDGYYFSAKSGLKSKNRGYFEIDHIKPRSAGGKTSLDNLQLLTWWENRQKGDKYEEPADADILLVVEYPDGSFDFDDMPTKTYIQAIEKAGIDNVKGLNIVRSSVPLISSVKNSKYSQAKLSNGEYLFTNLSTDDKKRMLDKINSELSLGWKIEIINDKKKLNK